MIKVKTTLPSQPFPGNTYRSPVNTKHLVIRPITQDDLAAFHSLRTQPEVMEFTVSGRIDSDLAHTQTRLDPFLQPRDAETYNPAICLASTGEFIGLGGVWRDTSELGWPEVGYMLKREYWGQGYATEFLEAFLQMWWKLPRSEAEVQVDELSTKAQEGDAVPEMLCAIIAERNPRSLRVVEKAGFSKFKEWMEPSRRPGTGGTEEKLFGFAIAQPEKHDIP
ncbi:acyl-CoA N-acyltransferase [Xylariomycetidae sp. FL2044]|nr:acyl-CoA N-acyltransferase [Xylariomycetidae sp. FL2044]